MTFQGGNENAKVAFKKCTLFQTFKTEINDNFFEDAQYFYTALHMHNLNEYSDNYSDLSGILC